MKLFLLLALALPVTACASRPHRTPGDTRPVKVETSEPAHAPPTATLGDLFRSERVLFVIPEEDESGLCCSWGLFVDPWKRAGAEVTVRAASRLSGIPSDYSVWVLGNRNRWRKPVLEALARLGRTADVIPTGTGSFACAVPHPYTEGLTLGWIATEHGPAVKGLIRDLPNHGDSSFVRFVGDLPRAVESGRWDATD